MKIAILNITGGGMSGGYKKYLLNILPLIAKDRRVESILCALPESIDIRNRFESIPNVKFTTCKALSLLSGIMDLRLKKQLRRFAPDVIFLPTERPFRFNNVPVVNMIQNMEPFATGIDCCNLLEKIKLRVQRITGKHAIRRADGVVAPSGFVKDFMMKNLNIAAEKIGLAYHGMDPVVDSCRKPSTIRESLTGNFVFTAGSIRPARGLEDIIFAFEQLSAENLDIQSLVIAGESSGYTSVYHNRLQTWISEHNMSSKVYWAGNLTKDEMAWCYKNCQVFVMTSRVESFGMIACEAMAHGCLCVSADNPCLPEIFGDAAVYYPSGDAERLAEIITATSAWSDEKRNEMRETARKRASEFSWDVCARKTVDVLADAAGKGPVK